MLHPLPKNVYSSRLVSTLAFTVAQCGEGWHRRRPWALALGVYYGCCTIVVWLSCGCCVVLVGEW